MRRLSRAVSVAGYAVSTAFTNLWRHRSQTGMAVFATVVMLLVLNGFLIVVSNLNMAVRALEQKVNLIAYLRDDVSVDEGRLLRDRTNAIDGVIDTMYVSRDDALARLREQFADRTDLIDMISGNPLPASVEVRVDDVGRLRPIADVIRTDLIVDEVVLPEDAVDNLTRLARATRVGGAVTIVGFALVTVVVIGNTIRLAVYARRHEIELMSLVGASDWFVRWPFLLEGILYGLIGAMIVAVIVGIWYGSVEASIHDALRFLPLTSDPALPVQLAAISGIVGVAVGGIGSYLSVRRFLDG